MFSEPRRHAAHRQAFSVESDGMSDGLEVSRAAEERLRFLAAQGFQDAADERGRDVRLATEADPLRGPRRPEDRFEERDQDVAVRHARCIRGEPFVGRQLGPPDDAHAELREVTIGAAANGKRPVLPMEELIRDDGRMRIPVPARFSPGGQSGLGEASVAPKSETSSRAPSPVCSRAYNAAQIAPCA